MGDIVPGSEREMRGGRGKIEGVNPVAHRTLISCSHRACVVRTPKNLSSSERSFKRTLATHTAEGRITEDRRRKRHAFKAC
jgi:hypothetical protein